MSTEAVSGSGVKLKVGDHFLAGASDSVLALCGQIPGVEDVNSITRVSITSQEVWGQPQIQLNIDGRLWIFKIGEHRTLSDLDSTPEGMDDETVTSECPEAKVYHLMMEMLRAGGASTVGEVRSGALTTGEAAFVKTALDHIIPFSDKFAVVRNGVGWLTALGAIAVSIVAVAVIVHALPVITTVFAVMLIFQGGLFVVQGLAWYYEKVQKCRVAQEIGAGTFELQVKKAMAGLSMLEGTLWILLGIFMIAFPHVMLFGYTVTLLLQFVLFNIFFTATFLSMIALGGVDYSRHVTFREGLARALDATVEMPRWWRAILPGRKIVLPYHQIQNATWDKDICLKALDYLIEQMNPSLEELGQDTVKAAARAHYRLEDQLGAEGAKELAGTFKIDQEDYTGVNALREAVASETEGALKVAQALIKNVLKANEEVVLVDILSIRLGIIGFIVGGCLYNSLSIVKHRTGHKLGGRVDLEDIGGFFDFLAWMPLNYYFLDLDIPDRITALVENRGMGAPSAEAEADPLLADAE